MSFCAHLFLPAVLILCVLKCVCLCLTGAFRQSIVLALKAMSAAISCGAPLSIIVTRDTACRASTSTSSTDPATLQSMRASWSTVPLEEIEIHQVYGNARHDNPSPSSIVHHAILSLVDLCETEGGMCESLSSIDVFQNLRAAFFLDITGVLDAPPVNDPTRRGETLHNDASSQNILNLRMISSLDDDMMMRKNRRSSNAATVASTLPSLELRSKISQEEHKRFKVQVLDQCMRCLVCAVQGLADSVVPFPILEQVQPIEWVQRDILRALDAPLAYPIFSLSSERRNIDNTPMSSASPVPSTTAIAAGLLDNLVSMANQSTQRCIGR
jgi:hypothetical protein